MNKMILIVSIKMEVLINLIEPQDHFPTNYARGITEHINNHGKKFYEFQDRDYETLQDAEVTTVACIPFGMAADYPEGVRKQFIHILNPPYDYIRQEGDVFDIDVDGFTNIDKRIKGFYVRKDQYYTSCPHQDPTHIRRVENGLISCNIHRLSLYSQIMDYYAANRHKLPSKSLLVTDKEFNPNPSTINILTKILKNTIRTPLAIFQGYKMGVEKDVQINTLTKNGMLFDCRYGFWHSIEEKEGYTDDERLILFKLDILLSYRNTVLDTKHLNFFPVINQLAAPNLESLQFIMSGAFNYTITVYFEGLHQYQTYIFDLTFEAWVKYVNNALYPSPQIKGSIPEIKDDKLGYQIFVDVVTNINTFNSN